MKFVRSIQAEIRRGICTMSDITELIKQAATSPDAYNELYRRVNETLARLARKYLRKDLRNQTLETMDLVNEAYIRLVRLPSNVNDRAHFFRLYAQVMRHVLCDKARSKLAKKHGGGCSMVELREDDWITDEQSYQWLQAQELLAEIEARYPDEVQVFLLTHLCGLKTSEIIQVFLETEARKMSKSQVKQAIRFIQTMVLDRLQDRSGPPS